MCYISPSIPLLKKFTHFPSTSNLSTPWLLAMDGHGRRRPCCRAPCLLLLFLLSALPLSFLISMERTKWSTPSYEYRSLGWLRECTKWDAPRHRFLVSRFEGGVSQILAAATGNAGRDLVEEAVVDDSETAGNASLGMAVDLRRNRVLVAVADVMGHRYGGLAGYDLSSWERLFLAHLAGPGQIFFYIICSLLPCLHASFLSCNYNTLYCLFFSVFMFM